MNEDVAYIKQRMQDYCLEVYTLGKTYPPPGSNAAHGEFVTRMLPITQVYKNYPRTFVVGSDAQKMCLAFRRFPEDCERAFIYGLHKGTFIDAVKILKDSIIAGINVLIDLVDLAGQPTDSQGQKRQQQRIKQHLAEDTQAFIRGLNSEQVVSGNHGNGWVAHMVLVELEGSRRMQRDQMQNITDPTIIALNNLWTGFLDRIQSIDATNQDPWLTGKWQIEFMTVHHALAFAIDLIEDKDQSNHFRRSLSQLQPNFR